MRCTLLSHVAVVILTAQLGWIVQHGLIHMVEIGSGFCFQHLVFPYMSSHPPIGYTGFLISVFCFVFYKIVFQESENVNC